MKSILSMMKNDWKIRFLFWSLVVCTGMILFMMVMLVKII
jgi:hypothetical protein